MLVENHISYYQNFINSILAGLGIIVTAATLVTSIKAFNGIENKLYGDFIIVLLAIASGLQVILLALIISKHVTLSYLHKIDNAYLEVIQR